MIDLLFIAVIGVASWFAGYAHGRKTGYDGAIEDIDHLLTKADDLKS